MTFTTAVDSTFDFLVKDYGFSKSPITGNPDDHVEYFKDPLSVEFWWGKGEIDINFCVSLAFASSHSIFRPYLTRTFGLFQVIRHINPRSLDALTRRSGKAEYITNLPQAQQYLTECAHLMRKHCSPLLKGDLQVLEELTGKR